MSVTWTAIDLLNGLVPYARRVVLALQRTDGSFVAAQGSDSGELRVAADITLDPTNLATSAKQDTGNSTLASILAKLIAAPATEATLAALDAKVTAVNTGAVIIDSDVDRPIHGMTKVHGEIHEGTFFFAACMSPTLNSATHYWSITTPDTAKRGHFELDVSCNVQCDAFLYENPTINAAGTPCTVFNANRDSGTAATLVVKSGATSTADGTLLWADTFGGVTQGNGKTSGGSGIREEIILKRNEEYFVKVTTLASGGIVRARFAWYEEAV